MEDEQTQTAGGEPALSLSKGPHPLPGGEGASPPEQSADPLADLRAEVDQARESQERTLRQAQDERAEADQLRAHLAEVEAALRQAQDERAERDQLRQQLAGAQDQAIAAHRRALLAENVGRVVPELVRGATVEELDASVEPARAAYARAVEAARAELAAAGVPTGAPAREASPPVESLSAFEKISQALRR